MSRDGYRDGYRACFIGVRIYYAEWEKLAAVAEQDHQSLSEVVREALRLHLAARLTSIPGPASTLKAELRMRG